MSLLITIKAIKGQLIGTFGLALLAGLSTRHDLVRAADRTLCKREFKERSHKRSLVTWFFLTNFKDVIPKSMYIWYYTQLALCPICSIILYIMARNGAVKEDIIAAWDLYALAVSVPIVIYWWFFLGREGNGNIVPRFIPRRHVMTQKHTQPKRNSNRPKKNTKPEERSKERQSSKQE